MSAADVLLFPSLWEGLGMVAVEAQAAGLKVVAADNLPDETLSLKTCEEKSVYRQLQIELMRSFNQLRIIRTESNI
ncbi:MAG: glycosyltransferase [Saprospiraceae bacterium]|nr:glycosyltransferase [Saprospiraceae bacterium]